MSPKFGQKPAAKSEREKVVGWQKMIDAINAAWKKAAKKMDDEPGYPFTGKDMTDLRRFAADGYYGAWGVAALYEIYCETADEFTIKAKFAIFHFTRALPRLLDKDDWKNRRKRYHDRWQTEDAQTVGDLLGPLFALHKKK